MGCIKTKGNVPVKRISRAKAVRDKCIDCIYDPLDKGTHIYQTTKCRSTDCALWPIRPINKQYANAQDLGKEEEDER